MKIGTYKQCSNCKSDDNCCNNFKKNIDNVMIYEKEYFDIIKKLNITDPHIYFSKIDEKIYNIKENNGSCVFYKNGKCEIYNYRPNDCKLYPFDIIKKEESYYLILYNLKCINEKEFIKECEKIDQIIDNIKPWINSYTNQNSFPKLKEKIDKEEYIVIKKIDITNDNKYDNI